MTKAALIGIVALAAFCCGKAYGTRSSNRETFYRIQHELFRTAKDHTTNNYYAAEVLRMANRNTEPKLSTNGKQWLKWLEEND